LEVNRGDLDEEESGSESDGRNAVKGVENASKAQGESKAGESTKTSSKRFSSGNESDRSSKKGEEEGNEEGKHKATEFSSFGEGLHLLRFVLVLSCFVNVHDVSRVPLGDSEEDDPNEKWNEGIDEEDSVHRVDIKSKSHSNVKKARGNDEEEVGGSKQGSCSGKL